ncbi:putative RRM domain-containing protein [Seiridium cardinale]|uniref:Nucleolar protein 12 n=1 Tax=Seiridium cardinale TaxID=138064 RepID=A0ABR2XDN1_9PEZI
MGKGRTAGIAAPQATIDKTLNDLFASSSGPVKAPPSTRYADLLPLKEPGQVEPVSDEDGGEVEEDDEELSELDEELDDDDNELSSGEDSADGVEDGGTANSDVQSAAGLESESDDAAVKPESKKKDRKRKRKDEFEDLEDKYLSKLVDEDDAPSEKRRREDSDKESTGESTNKSAKADDNDDDGDAPILHESLVQKSDEHADIEVDKANRTLFLGNVSSEAIASSKAKKQLMTHLASPLSELDASSGPHKVESLRFRSVAVAGGGMPKRAAYITKALMSTTTKSTNAYVVYSSPLAARAALKALNGTVVLDRHLRADSVAHPSPVAHRRCVFVGNLGFVDDETVLTTDADGETKAKKRTKTPADFEEGLWRVLSQHAGKVESVRVPRDAKTRVGKGFAYVQFYDGNDVEGALLLDGKKFPPMLPRILRVSRAKDPKKTALAMERSTKVKLEAMAATGKAKGLDGAAGQPKSTKYKHKATPEQQSLAGRASRLFGRAGAAREAQRLKGGDKETRRKESKSDGGVDLSTLKTPEQIVFEGRRASSKDGKPKDLKFGKVKGKKRPPLQAKKRGARRAAEWRKKGDN